MQFYSAGVEVVTCRLASVWKPNVTLQTKTLLTTQMTNAWCFFLQNRNDLQKPLRALLLLLLLPPLCNFRLLACPKPHWTKIHSLCSKTDFTLIQNFLSESNLIMSLYAYLIAGLRQHTLLKKDCINVCKVVFNGLREILNLSSCFCESFKFKKLTAYMKSNSLKNARYVLKFAHNNFIRITTTLKMKVALLFVHFRNLNKI